MDSQQEILSLALAMYRDPLDFVGLADPRTPLPEGVTHLLSLTGSAVPSPEILPVGVSLAELREAALFFIKRVLLAPGGDHYRVLGVPSQASNDLIKQHFRLLIRLFHPDRQKASGQWYESYAVRVNQAYEVLRNPTRRQTFDASSATSAFRDSPRKAYKSVNYFSSRRSARFSHDVLEKEHSRLWVGLGWGAGVVLIVVFSVLFLYQDQEADYPNRAWERSRTTSQVATASSYVSSTIKPLAGVGLSAQASFRYQPSRQEIAKLASSTLYENFPTTGIRSSQPSLPVPERMKQKPSSFRPPVATSKGSLDPEARIAALLRRGEKQASGVQTQLPSATIGEDGLWQQSGMPSVGAVAENRVASVLPEKTAQHVNNAPPVRLAAPAPTISAAVAKPSLGRRDLQRLVRQFSQSYKSGDLDSFVALFDDYAQVNQQYSKAGIRKTYSAFFASTKQRSIHLNNIIWKNKGSSVLGNGDIQLKVQKKGSFFSSSAQGTFRMRLKKQQAHFLITDLSYSLND